MLNSMGVARFKGNKFALAGQSGETLKVPCFFGFGLLGFFCFTTNFREQLCSDPSHFMIIFQYKEIFQVPDMGTGKKKEN